jgi:hypothetical protein
MGQTGDGDGAGGPTYLRHGGSSDLTTTVGGRRRGGGQGSLSTGFQSLRKKRRETSRNCDAREEKSGRISGGERLEVEESKAKQCMDTIS